MGGAPARERSGRRLVGAGAAGSGTFVGGRGEVIAGGAAWVLAACGAEGTADGGDGAGACLGED